MITGKYYCLRCRSLFCDHHAPVVEIINYTVTKSIENIIDGGVKHFRIEMLNQSEEEMTDILETYRKLLSGRINGREVWAKLKAANRIGVTRGTLEERRNPLAIL